MKSESSPQNLPHSIWNSVFLGLWHSPLGLFGILLTTASASLLLIGIIAELSGALANPYTGILIFTILPAGMVIGLILMPLAAYLQR